MHCTSCGAQNDDGVKYCVQCGAQLTPAPGTPLPAAVHQYAGFWRRVLAILIDAIILMTAVFLIDKSWWLGPHPPFFLIGIVIYWLYFALFESSRHQATIGKVALGIIVTDTAGRRISFGRATGRYFGKYLSSLILCIGFLMVAFTEKKQGLHDMLADTLVVRK